MWVERGEPGDFWKDNGKRRSREGRKKKRNRRGETAPDEEQEAERDKKDKMEVSQQEESFEDTHSLSASDGPYAPL